MKTLSVNHRDATSLKETPITAMARATLDPAKAFGRHPLQPHQLLDRVTRVEDTIVLCHLGVPRIDRAEWSLTVDGLVRRDMHFTLDELMRRPRTEIASIHQCCGSPLKPELPTRRICNVMWSGVRLSELLAECGPDPTARYVWSSGADHGTFEGDVCDAFVKDLPLDRATDDVLIAFEMNGSPLPPENGYPARLVVPGYYGTNSVKWLTRLSVADARSSGPFTTRWYNDPVLDASGRPTGATIPVGPIAPESVIVSPAPDQTLAVAEVVEVWGWAWADGGVSAVDLSTDGMSVWTPAAIEPPAGHAWQRFTATWRPDHSGTHELSSRAQLADGRRQPPSGARNAIYRVPVNVV
jgi:DMSO/TMAO reductase YedYZ molybdopterin-dependent catalytic subunit